GDFIAQAGILDKIYEIKPNLSIEEKAPYIFQKLFTLAASLSPVEFEGNTKESQAFTLSNYSSYLLNINRLLLWQKLPGGREYLSQVHIKALSLKKKGELLTQWIEEHGKNIINLNLNKLGLMFLPIEIAQFSKLQKLDLSINRLTAIPREIGQLPQLRILRVNNNQLTVIPPEIGQLSHLQVLGLSNNQLTVIPSEIGQLSQLKALGLSNNQLTAIPVEIGQLLRLKELNLSNNPLTVIPHLPKVKMFNYGQSSSYFS
ncbi:leucine-rich repeat domain-containing protein, partial [Neochlamydia sp. AcF95]|uniref:leucine-rich repeat domain-containing protein n=1 Tax=Neochlamydia sp. AcF95 TaxID=2795734 RepID=UPI001BCA1D4F